MNNVLSCNTYKIALKHTVALLCTEILMKSLIIDFRKKVFSPEGINIIRFAYLLSLRKFRSKFNSKYKT